MAPWRYAQRKTGVSLSGCDATAFDASDAALAGTQTHALVLFSNTLAWPAISDVTDEFGQAVAPFIAIGQDGVEQCGQHHQGAPRIGAKQEAGYCHGSGLRIPQPSLVRGETPRLCRGGSRSLT